MNSTIVRIDPTTFSRKKLRKGAWVQRKPDDPDLSWSDGESTYRVYVIGETEWFDPMTSTRYSENGVSNHAMFGPSVIVSINSVSHQDVRESHVNDPKVWAWVRRSISRGYLSHKTIDTTLVNDEALLTESI